MKGDKIKYQSGYKHQLREDYSVTNGHPLQTTVMGFDIDTGLIKLTPDGKLNIYRGYAWDGASGPTWDTPTVMRASLVHDVFYQLMREELLPLKYRAYADDLLRDIMKEDGAWGIRAWYYHLAVDKFGLKGATCENEREIITAP